MYTGKILLCYYMLRLDDKMKIVNIHLYLNNAVKQSKQYWPDFLGFITQNVYLSFSTWNATRDRINDSTQLIVPEHDQKCEIALYYSFIPRRFLNILLLINMVPLFYYNLYYKEIRS